MAETAVHPRKAQIAEELKELLVGSRVVGLVGVTGIPAPQMQKIRAGLRDRVELRVVKNRLLLRALEAAAKEMKGVEKLEDLIHGQTALVLTDSNPFKLFKELEATKTKAPARGGEIAPEDIEVKEGDTPFKPGPVVGDLQKAGIPAAIEGGKVVIKKDKVLVEKGQRIPRNVAQVLARLEIFPMTVGLDLRGVYEDGRLFTRDVLAVDDEEIRRQMITAFLSGVSLSLAIAFPTRSTVVLLLADAHRRALGLGVAMRFPEEEVLPHLLSRAHAEVTALASRVPEALGKDQGAVVESPPLEEASEEKTRKKEEEKGEGEEEAAAGLNSLSE
ncbi:MAG: 50S ribosomal protein L10 [Thermoplasmata archaeon]